MRANIFRNGTIGAQLCDNYRAQLIENKFEYIKEAIILEYCHYINISMNESQYNVQGITLLSSENEINYNNFSFNNQYAVYLDDFSDLNVIHHNNFFNNLNSNALYSQALDNGRSNTWYDIDLEEGNYWSDLPANATYYSIDGYAGSKDLYPLTEPVFLKSSASSYNTTTNFSSGSLKMSLIIPLITIPIASLLFALVITYRYAKKR